MSLKDYLNIEHQKSIELSYILIHVYLYNWYQNYILIVI